MLLELTRSSVSPFALEEKASHHVYDGVVGDFRYDSISTVEQFTG